MRKMLLGLVVMGLMAGASADNAKAWAGSVGGASHSAWNVPANGTHLFTRAFRAGETAVVAIIGDGDTDLDLYVYDADDNLIARSDGATDRERCCWVPRSTGKFKIKVVNRGNVYNRCHIFTN